MKNARINDVYEDKKLIKLHNNYQMNTLIKKS